MISGKAFWQEGGYWVVKPDRTPNFDHIRTINDGEINGVPVELETVDPRQARPKQRALFFALLQDIWQWSGEDKEFLKEWFYTRYTIRTAGKTISLADRTENTVTDAKFLIDDVINFIFEYDVPVKAGYELLPRDEEYMQYLSIKHRKCLICGLRADIHHVDEIGMGRDRNHIDHTQHRLAALCRKHHTEAHQLGLTEFCKRHHLTRLGIKVNAETLKQIGLRGEYHGSSN